MKEITVFAKRRTSKEGKPFTIYLATIPKKDGMEQIMQVKFRQDCGNPRAEDCPINIVVDKESVNISTKHHTNPDTGVITTSNILWVSSWKKGSEYVDHSTDDYDI